MLIGMAWRLTLTEAATVVLAALAAAALAVLVWAHREGRHRPALALRMGGGVVLGAPGSDLGLRASHLKTTAQLVRFVGGFQGRCGPKFGNPELRLSTCAVQRRRFPVGASPTRRTRSRRKQPEQSWR